MRRRVTPNATAGLVAGYGTHGSCWADPSYADTCRQACNSSLTMFHDAYPYEAACRPISAENPSGPEAYPPGPYGATKGSTIANLEFLGKVDPRGASGTSSYGLLTATTLRLSDYHDDSAVHWVVIAAIAGWCGPCLEQAKTIPKTSQAWEAAGARFMTVLVQGFDEANGTRAQTGDIDKWQAKTNQHTAIAIDEADDLVSATLDFPTTWLVRTSDMSILHVEWGVAVQDPRLDPILEEYAN